MRKSTDNHERTYEKNNKPKVIAKRYNVTSQTAYHVAQLAMEFNTSEGRIIDKIMRSYLAEASVNNRY